MTDKEKIAYIVGMAVAIGFKLGLRKQGLSFDANTNNPYWVTTENGHHFLIDKFGTIQGGRLKGTPIDNVKKHYSGIKNKKEKNINAGAELSRSYGPEIKTKLAGVDAIRKISRCRFGHIKDLWDRKSVGKIDLMWGTPSMGLCHMYKRVKESKGKLKESEFFKIIDTAISKGHIYQNDRDTSLLAVDPKSKMAVVISKNFKGNGGVLVPITIRPLEPRKLETLKRIE